MTRRRIALVALLLLVGGAGVWFLRGGFPWAPREAPARALTPEERAAMLENSLRALEDGVRDAQRDRWDPAYVVTMVGRNPDSLHRWVRENTTWIPYRGTLRGPVGVLMDRQGNSLDRALLLADLLQRAGHSVRLARTEFSFERAVALLPTLSASRQAVLDGDAQRRPTGPQVPIAQRAAEYGLDGKSIERTLANYDEATTKLLNKVEERVASHTAKLLSIAGGIHPATEWAARADSALAALRDHWWVQLAANGSWEDLDLVRPDSAGVLANAALMETFTPSTLDPSVHHRVTIRVVTERLTGGHLVESSVLEHALTPSDFIGRPIVLQFWPTAWHSLDSTSGSARSLRLFALEQDQWRASLLIGNDAVAEATVDVSTRSAERATGSLGGLGGAMTRALDRRRDAEDSLLTAASIEYVIDVPGRPQRVIRRSVFDLIGPAARHAGVAQSALTFDERQRLDRSLALMMRTEILPLAARPNADFVAHLAARSVLANADLLRAVSQPGFGSQAHKLDSLLNAAQPGVGPLYAFAALRHEAIGNRAFLDQPTILTRHRYPRTDGDSIALADATDIVANELGIALNELDGFIARMVQGTWDTNLEAMLGLAGGPVGNAAAAFDETRNWLTLTRRDKERLSELRLPPDALRRIAQHLDSGYTVVAPREPVTVDRREFTAWWRIQPETGDALGFGENGWGQGSEYSLTTNILITGARAFTFEYGLCQFIPQAANSLRVIGGEFWRLGIAPSWTRPPEPGKDFEDVAIENNRMCLKQAMLAGFLATAPLLIETVRYRLQAQGVRRMQVILEEVEAAAANLRRNAKCLCTIGPTGTQPIGDLTRAQVRGGSMIPEGGVGGGRGGPIGARETGVDPRKTQFDPLSAPAPSSGAEVDMRKADEAVAIADRNYRAAVNDFIRYRTAQAEAGLPWDMNHVAELHRRVQAADQRAVIAIHEARAAEAALSAGERAEREAANRLAEDAARIRHGMAPKYEQPTPPPRTPGCPPNCAGNEKVTMPQEGGSASRSGALQAGAAGVAGSLTGGSRPPQ